MKRIGSTLGLWILFLGVCLAVYWPVVSESPILEYDDSEIYSPLGKVQSWQQYWQWVGENRIIDRQPVRDFSYWLDHQMPGFWSPHLSNLIFFSIAGLLVFLLCLRLGISRAPALGASLLVLAHPVATNSVAWISGRKHLLSMLFALASVHLFLNLKDSITPREKLKNLTLLCAAFAMCVFSQPINVGWPLFFALILWSEKQRGNTKKNLSSWCGVLAVGGIAAAAAWINSRYYSSQDYQILLGGIKQGKVLEESLEVLRLRVLVFGKYLMQVLWPFSPSIFSYKLGRPGDLIGVVLLPLVAWALLKNLPRHLKLWLVALVIPLLPVTVRMTHHQGWDTYLLTSLMISGLFWAQGLQWIWKTSKNQSFFRNSGMKRFFSVVKPKMSQGQQLVGAVFLALFPALFLGLAVLSHHQTSFWTNEVSLWQRAVELDPNNINQLNFARVMQTKARRPAEAFAIARKVWLATQDDFGLDYLYSASLYAHPGMSDSQKYQLLRIEGPSGPWSFYHLAVLQGKGSGAWSASANFINQKIDDNPHAFCLSFADELPTFVTNLKRFCQQAQLPSPNACETNAQKLCNTCPSRFFPVGFRCL